MTVLLLGYRSTKHNATPEPLYVGTSPAVARELQATPPEGIVRTELYSHIRPTRTRHHGTTERELQAAPQPQPAEPKQPEPEQPEPKSAKPKQK